MALLEATFVVVVVVDIVIIVVVNVVVMALFLVTHQIIVSWGQ